MDKATKGSVLISAVEAFDTELKRFVQSVSSEVQAVKEALTQPVTRMSSATNTVVDDNGDAAAPFLNMVTHATEDVEDEIESIGRISGVTVPRAQQLLEASVGVHQQQAKAVEELQRMLCALGVAVPPPKKQNCTIEEPIPVSNNTDVLSIRRESGRLSRTEEREHTQISVDTSTGRVSVSRRHIPVNYDDDTLDDEIECGEPTVLAVPRPQKQEPDPNEDEEARMTEEPEEDKSDNGLFIVPFSSMEEVMTKVPSFLISTTTSLEDINAGVIALNKAYAAQQEHGKACQLTNEEANAALGGDSLFLSKQSVFPLLFVANCLFVCVCVCVKQN